MTRRQTGDKDAYDTIGMSTMQLSICTMDKNEKECSETKTRNWMLARLEAR
jgi:hypothetical protein